MAYIVTRLCRDCVDTGCVAACPVDCIYRYQGEDAVAFPNQLYVHPEECIDCGACEPECPWGAIFEEESVPENLREDVALNYAIMNAKGEFVVAEHLKLPPPRTEQVSANREKWGLSAV